MSGRGSCGLAIARVNIGAQIVARNSGGFLKIQHALGGNSVLGPLGQRAFIDTEVASYMSELDAAIMQKVFDLWRSHICNVAQLATVVKPES